MYYWIALWFIFPKAFVSFQVEELSKILHCGRNEDNTKSDVEVQTEDHAPWSISGIQCLVGMHESEHSYLLKQCFFTNKRQNTLI